MATSSRTLLAVCVVATGLLAFGVVVAGASRSAARVHSETKMQACLLHHGVSPGRIATASPLRKYLPPGVTGELNLFGNLPGAPAHIDDGTIYFFKSVALARKGQARLLSVWVFGTGLSPLLKAMVGFAPPTQAAGRALVKQTDNTVVVWQYPRHQQASSNRIINACLAAT